jgi:ADP-ribose pyrophosphatase
LEFPLITRKSIVYQTPWFKLVEKQTTLGSAPFYSLQTLDYLCVVAVNTDDQLVLVRQYRPAIERVSLELPAGHVDPGEAPEAAARRELLEETGYHAQNCELLGALPSDTGRFENKTWCFLARDCSPPEKDFAGESGVEVITTPRLSACGLIRDAKLDCALHYTAMALVMASRGSGYFGGPQ